jgi:cytochrome d ubiquinol oxidase subunit I
MAYLGSLAALLALWGAWLWWRRRLPTARVFLWVATWAVAAPLVMNTAGWMLTENGRQPWIVQGLMKTTDGVSPSVSTTELVLSIAVFYGVFALLGAVNVFLMLRFARRGLELEPDEADEPADGQPGVPVLTF